MMRTFFLTFFRAFIKNEVSVRPSVVSFCVLEKDGTQLHKIPDLDACPGYLMIY